MAPEPTTATAVVKDVTESDFTREVLEASSTRPVVVDFWATWCGPCRQLSPLLEAAAERYAGEVDLVKVDVDTAPNLSRAFRVQGIPAVKAFRDGRLVAEFTGAQPAAVVERLFASLAPSQADRLAAEAAATADPDEAERRYREALAAQADHPAAVVGLARLLADRDDVAGARELLARVGGASSADPEARRLMAELDLALSSVDEPALVALRARADDGDAEARVELGQALAAAGRHDEALEVLVSAAGDADVRERARAAVLEVFAVLGDADERVRTWRPRLARALF
jgi:putative thioredoxin